MKNNKAFTLVELIIVIAVIGVLAAILIPIFSNVIDKANAKSALSDAKNSMEQVIAEGTENDAMPENILIIVRKAKNFYVYGFNRMTDGCLYQSPGNPFSGFSDVQSLIDARSWNSLQGDTTPDLETAYTDHDTYGYFYLVPYSGGVSQAPTVRGIRAANEYPEISDPINGLMTENMGDDVYIYHGVLTDKVNTDEQTEGNASATPTPAATPTPTPSAEPTPQPTDTWVNPPVVGNYTVALTYMNWDGSDWFSHANTTNTETVHLDLGLGDNRFSFDSLPYHATRYLHRYDQNLGYKVVPIECGDTSFTPIDYLTVHLGDVDEPSVGVFVYCAVVRRDDAPSDNSSLMAGRYSIVLRFYNTTGDDYYMSDESVMPDEHFFYDLDYNESDTHGTTTYIPVDLLINAGKWKNSPAVGYHYVAVQKNDMSHTPLEYVEVKLNNPYQADEIIVNVYTALVPNE